MRRPRAAAWQGAQDNEVTTAISYSVADSQRHPQNVLDLPQRVQLPCCRHCREVRGRFRVCGHGRRKGAVGTSFHSERALPAHMLATVADKSRSVPVGCSRSVPNPQESCHISEARTSAADSSATAHSDGSILGAIGYCNQGTVRLRCATLSANHILRSSSCVVSTSCIFRSGKAHRLECANLGTQMFVPVRRDRAHRTMISKRRTPTV